MDRVCQYSTIIFAGNVSVLLLVSVMTDYWEYRGFKEDYIISNLPRFNGTEITYLEHTNTCFILHHKWYNKTHPRLKIPRDNLTRVTYFQPPAILHKYFYFNETVEHRYDVTAAVGAGGATGLHNVSRAVNVTRKMPYDDYLVLYREYGNLFRNCDDLEGTRFCRRSAIGSGFNGLLVPVGGRGSNTCFSVEDSKRNDYCGILLYKKPRLCAFAVIKLDAELSCTHYHPSFSDMLES